MGGAVTTTNKILGSNIGQDFGAAARGGSQQRLAQPPDPRYRLPGGTTVIVDEAGMLPTARLAELAAVADARGWRIVLVGDPLQFSAVGRGGMFGLLVDTFGGIELDSLHSYGIERRGRKGT